MGKKCQVDDNIRSDDQVNHKLVSSVSYHKTSEIISRDFDISTLSSERLYSANNSLIKSDMSSEIGQTLNEKRKNPSVGTPEEISQGESTTMAPYPYKQLKADSSSSRNSGAIAQLSSVDSVDVKPAHVLSNREHSNPTQSAESNKVFPEREFSVKSSHREFDLNESMEGNRANWHSKSIHELNYSSSSILSEPIPVVAKVGVPVGFPEKPFQFGGEHGWKRSGVSSAFSPTPLKSRDIKTAPVSRGFDLNIAATPDPDVPVDEASVYVSPKVPERIQFHGQSRTQNHHKPATIGFDLNHNPVTEELCRSNYPQGQTRQLLGNFNTSSTVLSPNASNWARPSYLVDLSSIHGYGHVQGQPFLLGAPNSEQMQMVVPIQLPQTSPGFYIGNFNNLNPTFYPPRALPPLHIQPGPHVLATNPGNARLVENSNGLNPYAFANMRQTIHSNGSKAGNTYGEQIIFPGSRREPEAGWGSSQVNCREMASWK